MRFVLDVSIALRWYFEDGVSANADAVLDLLAEDAAVIPSVWPLEIANGLLSGQRRGRLTAAERTQTYDLILTDPLALHDVPLERALGTVADLAAVQRLSAYDAAYLDRAMRLGFPQATQDENLHAAANRVGVPRLQPASP
jgi:predicted nucleic acid-binding protein